MSRAVIFFLPSIPSNSAILNLCSFDGGSHSDNDMGQFTKTGAAGGIIILVSTYIFLFLFGSEETASEPSIEITKA